MYREIFAPVDNSQYADWAVDRAIELCRRSSGRLTSNHVYAARLHDVRFRQLETGLPARFQTSEEIKKQILFTRTRIRFVRETVSTHFLNPIGHPIY